MNLHTYIHTYEHRYIHIMHGYIRTTYAQAYIYNAQTHIFTFIGERRTPSLKDKAQHVEDAPYKTCIHSFIHT